MYTGEEGSLKYIIFYQIVAAATIATCLFLLFLLVPLFFWYILVSLFSEFSPWFALVYREHRYFIPFLTTQEKEIPRRKGRYNNFSCCLPKKKCRKKKKKKTSFLSPWLCRLLKRRSGGIASLRSHLLSHSFPSATLSSSLKGFFCILSSWWLNYSS